MAVAAAVILVLAGIGSLLAKAPFLNEESIRAEISSRLTAWTGSPATFSGPFELHYFPTPYLFMGGLTLETAPDLPHLRTLTAKRVTIDLGLWSLISSQPVLHRLTLLEPRIELQTQARDREKEMPPTGSLLARAVRSAPVPEFRLLNGTVTVSGPETSERITGLDLGLNIALPQARFDGDGDLQWRGEALSFDFAGTAPPLEADAALSPLTLSVNGPLVSANMRSRGRIENGIRATGSLDLEITDLRRFARWVGLRIPEGRGLESFQASGEFNWRDQRMEFDESSFTLDGNRALGALAFDLAGPRPAVEGTLAFSTFDLSQYEKPEEDAEETETAEAREEAPTAAEFPLLQHFDVDLRLSTNEIVATPIRLGQVALSATVNAGRLTADFAILDICGGSGNGRFLFDAAAQSQIRLMGNMTGLAAKTCIGAFMPQSPIAGNLGLSVDLSSRGRTETEILRHLEGTLTASAGPGEIGIDLAVLTSPTESGGVEAWKPLTGGTTSFSKAVAELTFRQGTIFSENLEIVSEEKRYTGKGTIALPDQMLNLHILSRDADGKAGSSDSAPYDEPATVAELSGPWTAPRFRVHTSGAEATPESGEDAETD